MPTKFGSDLSSYRIRFVADVKPELIIENARMICRKSHVEFVSARGGVLKHIFKTDIDCITKIWDDYDYSEGGDNYSYYDL